MGESSKLLKLDKKGWLLAIDPGVSGGIARFWGDGTVEAWGMPVGEEAIASFIYGLFAEIKGMCRGVFLEKVWGRAGNSAKSNTSFMTHYGFLRGTLRTCAVDYNLTGVQICDVLPKEWMNALDAPKMSRDTSLKASKRKTQHKNALKLMALGFFPDLKITLKTADALLIGEYVRRDLCD